MPRLSDEEPDDDLSYEGSFDPNTATNHVEKCVDEKGYVPGWSWIASGMRSDADHCCEVCRIRLKEKPHLLHVHHLDRDKLNNDKKNLQVRCAICHSLCDGHAHILRSINPSDIAYLRDLQAKKEEYLRNEGGVSGDTASYQRMQLSRPLKSLLILFLALAIIVAIIAVRA